MKIINILLLSLLVTIAGCTSTSSGTKLDREQYTVIDIVNEFKNESQQGFSLYDLYDPSGLNPGFTKKGYGYSAYQRWWCTKTPDAISNLKNRIKNHCELKSGQFSNDWCHTENGALFRAKLGQADLVEPRTATPFCKSGHELGVLAVTSEDQTDMKTWNDWIVTELSYRTPTQISEQQELSEKEAVKKIEAEKLSMDANAKAILHSGIGTKICQRQGNIEYVGFVEDIVNGKLKVLLSDAFYKTSRSIRPNGFQQKLIWDVPRNWTPCS